MKNLFALSLTCYISSFGFAETLSVPSQYSTIQSAVDAASTGDTVEVAAGTYYESLTINKAITVISLNGASNTIIDADGACNVIKVVNQQNWPPLTIDGFTITGGVANWSGTQCLQGGGFHINNSKLHVKNCVISGNTCDQNGGGVYILGPSTSKDGFASVYFYDSLITENHANYGGGGVHISNGGLYTEAWCNLINTPVYGNTSNTEGREQFWSLKGYFAYSGGDYWMTDPTGACCLGQGGCIISTESNCTKAGGTYQGNETSCSNNCDPVPPATGACCLEPSGCIITTEDDCSLLNGNYYSYSYSCDKFECGAMPQSGGCCTNGNCYDLTENVCEQINGEFQGVDQYCDGQAGIQSLEVLDYCCGGYQYAISEFSIEFDSTDGYGGHYGTFTVPQGEATLIIKMSEIWNSDFARVSIFNEANGDHVVTLTDSDSVTIGQGEYSYSADSFAGSISWPSSDPIECMLADCAADLNGDGGVDVNDLLLLLASWGTCP